jgi:hypothetical protein
MDCGQRFRYRTAGSNIALLLLALLVLLLVGSVFAHYEM